MARVPHPRAATEKAVTGLFTPSRSAEDVAIFEKAKSDPAIITAANITNGMHADLVFAAVVKAARASGH